MPKLFRTGFFVLLAVVATASFARIALGRGETINAAWLLTFAIATYAVAYRFYSKLIATKVFALDLDLQFRELGDGPELARGAGKVVDMSSDAILFTPDCELKPGSRLEVSLSWPVRLDGRVALRLVARGVVMGFRDPNAVVAIQNYEFRTQRSAPDANNQAPKVS